MIYGLNKFYIVQFYSCNEKIFKYSFQYLHKYEDFTESNSNVVITILLSGICPSN